MQNVVIRAIERLDFRTKEAYKTLRTNLSFAGKNVKVISLTSCTPNEGKTSVSFQLCLSLAESGKQTILVDADLRKSVLRGRYKANREKYGLSHYLSGQVELDDACCRTNVNNFDIIFAGPVPPNPSELLGGDAFRNMLEVLRMKYDYVIVDTPPLGSVIDAAIVGAICDGTVIVVESGAITEDEARVHPQRNLITRVVGVHPEVECDYGCYKFEPGDLALSCTDGLSNYLERDTLLLFISNYQGEELADELIRYANSKGGSDNVTVAVIENR